MSNESTNVVAFPVSYRVWSVKSAARFTFSLEEAQRIWLTLWQRHEDPIVEMWTGDMWRPLKE